VKIKVNIPDSLNDITLGQYQKWSATEGDDEFRALKLVEIICGITLRDVSQMRKADVDDISQAIADQFQIQQPLTRTFKLDDKTFGFIPNLDDISLGEYTDIEDNIGDWQKMHKAMAVLFRPIHGRFGMLYNLEDYEGTDKYAEAIKGMPLGVAMGAVNFIYRLGTELCKDILTSMARELKATASPMSDPSLNGGGGTTSSTHLRMEMLLALKQLAGLTSTSLSLTAPTKSKREKQSAVN
jgi:hypothetical protein